MQILALDLGKYKTVRVIMKRRIGDTALRP